MSKNLRMFNKTDKRVLVAKLALLMATKELRLRNIEENKGKMLYGTFVSVRNKVLQDMKAISNVLNLVENA